MKYCQYCGNYIEGANFCSKCGKPVNNSVQKTQATPNTPKKKKGLFNSLKSTIVTESCPICGKDTNAFEKTMGKYDGKYICRDCLLKIVKSGIPAFKCKNKSLEELQRAAGIIIPKNKTTTPVNHFSKPVSPPKAESVTATKPVPVHDSFKKDVEKEEVERTVTNSKAHKKQRQSHQSFCFLMGNSYLKYKYYDVDVKGVEYRDFDIAKIEVNASVKFEPEPDNQYDSNAVKVICEDIFIGYVPKNTIQSMVLKYSKSDDFYLHSFVSEVDEDLKTIKIAIGFYKDASDNELDKLPHLSASLTKTSKKDTFDIPRYENLTTLSVGDNVELEYQYDAETYLVSDCISELGEINTNKSKTLYEYELKGKEFASVVEALDYKDDGKIACKIRVYILD